MDSSALVSIICLCYNQEKFVREAIESAINQSHAPIEVIVVDDASSDNSRRVIEEVQMDYPQIIFIPLSANHGNCRAFNIGFEASKGEFLIDLACDDVLLPDRAAVGVEDFKKYDKDYGVDYCDVALITQQGKELGNHSDPYEKPMPQGDLYLQLVDRYLVNPASMMIRREVLNDLNGYDENLQYEDFDFWIRSARNYKYIYNTGTLVKKRITDQSHSQDQYRFRSVSQKSTYTVCKKIFGLNASGAEDDALKKRIRYEIRQCIRTANFQLATKYLKLHRKIGQRRLS